MAERQNSLNAGFPARSLYRVFCRDCQNTSVILNCLRRSLCNRLTLFMKYHPNPSASWRNCPRPSWQRCKRSGNPDCAGGQCAQVAERGFATEVSRPVQCQTSGTRPHVRQNPFAGRRAGNYGRPAIGTGMAERQAQRICQTHCSQRRQPGRLYGH